MTSLYLIKDTVYRWKERPSSALSRLLVVFFLSLCALSFLSNYVLVTKSIQDRIRARGGDLVILTDYEMGTTIKKVDLIKNELYRIADAELMILNDINVQGVIDETSFPIVEYGDEALSGLTDFPLDDFPYLVLLDKASPISEGPAVMNIQGYSYNILARRIPEGHMIGKVYDRGVILIPESVSAQLASHGLSRKYVIKVRDMTYEHIKAVDSTLRNICRMDKSISSVFSSEELLADLSLMMSNQNESRAGFSIGIAVIVGILLTALASMEFRENEYVYTLMKSFGVRPILLVMTFVVENMVLIGLAFVGAVMFFMEAQKIIMTEFFKLPNTLLTLEDLHDDLLLLGMSLIVCVVVSSVPIVASAYREIGRVLK